MVSGKVTAVILFCCLLVSGVLVPAASHLPRWVEFELVLATWWIIWAISLALMLYRGIAVADDVESPWERWKRRKGRSGRVTNSLTNGCGRIELGEGCGEVLGTLAVAIIIIIGIWLVIEVVLPALAFGLYFAIRGMLARVVNDRHDCQGSAARSILWGAIWAFVYTAPLALIVWGVHSVHRH